MDAAKCKVATDCSPPDRDTICHKCRKANIEPLFFKWDLFDRVVENPVVEKIPTKDIINYLDSMGEYLKEPVLFESNCVYSSDASSRLSDSSSSMTEYKIFETSHEENAHHENIDNENSTSETSLLTLPHCHEGNASHVIHNSPSISVPQSPFSYSIDSNTPKKKFCLSKVIFSIEDLKDSPLYPTHTPVTYETVYLKVRSFERFRYIINDSLQTFMQQLFFVLRVLQGNELILSLYTNNSVESEQFSTCTNCNIPWKNSSDPHGLEHLDNPSQPEFLLLQRGIHSVYRDWRLFMEFNPHKELIRSAVLDFIRVCVENAENADQDSYAQQNQEDDERCRYEYLSKEEDDLIQLIRKKKDVEIPIELFWPSKTIPHFDKKDNETYYFDYSSIDCLNKTELSTLCLLMGWLYLGNDDSQKAICWLDACVRVVENAKEAPTGASNMIMYYSRARLWENDLLLIREYRKAMRFIPHCPLPINNCAVAMTKLHKYQGALNYYTHSLNLDPNYVLSLNNRASLYCNEFNDYKKAEEDYETAIALGEDLSSTYLLRALLYKNYYRNYQRSIDDLTRSLEYPNSGREIIYCERAEAYSRNSEFQKALDDYNACLDVNSHYLDALYGRGGVYIDLNDYERALQDYNRCIEECIAQGLSNAAISAAFNNRGVLYFEKFKDPSKALRDFQIAITIHPESSYAIQNMNDIEMRIRETSAIGNL